MNTIDRNNSLQKYGNFGAHLQNGNGAVEPEVKLREILHTLKRRKSTLILCVIAMMALAVLYNKLSTPVYESSVLMKKEKTYDKNTPDNLEQILAMYNADEIETESEILKTRTVLKKVVTDLKLFFTINKITTPDSVIQKDPIMLFEYEHQLAVKSDSTAPRLQFHEFVTPISFRGGDFYLQVAADSMLELRDALTDSLLKKVKNVSPAEFDLPAFRFSVEWARALPGSRIDFRIVNPDRSIQNLDKNNSVEILRKTGLFKLTSRSSSPYMAQLIAGTVADKFLETRIASKREAINVTYNFVDNHLKEISEKLKNAEAELSVFRSKYHILNFDDVSKKTVDFVSELEAEKIKTELEIAENRNKYEALKQKAQKSGYIDQTYLTPAPTASDRSPFSALLEELSNAELKRLDLLQKRTENHPDLLALDERIAEIKKKLSEFNQNTITSYEIIINSLGKKQKNLEQSINKYLAREKALPRHETKLIELMRNKNAFETIVTFLREKREEMGIGELAKLKDIVIVDDASFPMKPVLPRKPFNLIVGFFFGIMLGVIVLILQEFRTKTIQNIAEIEKGFEIPILAILPEYNKKLKDKIHRGFFLKNHIDILRDPRMGFKESYRVVRTKMAQLLTKSNIVLFTSCEEGTGKTTVLANFALSLCVAGKKVLIIDCDLRKPKLGEFFYIDDRSPGMIDFLKSNNNMPHFYPSGENHFDPGVRLSVIPAGGIVENSSELLDSVKFKDFLRKASPHFDYILIDTPPVTLCVDGLVLGRFVKEVVLLIRPNLTYKDRLAWAMQDFNQFNIRILGSIVNACDMKLLELPYKRGYGYGYGYDYGDVSRITNIPLPSPAR